MKQHLKTKVLHDKALNLSASSCQQQIFYLYLVPPCKRSFKKDVILNLKVFCVYCKSFIIITVYFSLARGIAATPDAFKNENYETYFYNEFYFAFVRSESHIDFLTQCIIMTQRT